jgi:ribulose-phosphate 3-epimerase
MHGGICLAPSVLSADLLRLTEQIQEVEAAGADWIHVDVMDGHFVPNLTFGAGMIRAIRRVTSLPIDVHLMVERPEAYLEEYADAGASVFTFHPEATRHVQRHLESARRLGMSAGLALNPGSPLSLVAEVTTDLDLLLIMTVNPGFAAQSFLPSSPGKITRARQLLAESGGGARLEVDGGISRDTIGVAYRAGADTFVAGSAIFSSPAPGDAVRELRERCGTVT